LRHFSLFRRIDNVLSDKKLLFSSSVKIKRQNIEETMKKTNSNAHFPLLLNLLSIKVGKADANQGSARHFPLIS